MKTISLHVSEADYGEFKLLAATAGTSVADLIRSAMREWLVQQRRGETSLGDIGSLDCGAQLRAFDRAEVADEMFDR